MRRAKRFEQVALYCKFHPEQPVARAVYISRGRLLCGQCYYKTSKPRIERKNERTRKFIKDFKMTHPCVDCGESDWRCLDFDHIGEKSFTISHSHASYRLETIIKEIAKCKVRCANCHRKRHLTR